MTRPIKNSIDRIQHPIYRDRHIYNRKGVAYGVYKTKRFGLGMNFSQRARNELLKALEQRCWEMDNPTPEMPQPQKSHLLHDAYREFHKVYVSKLKRGTQKCYEKLLKDYFPVDMYFDDPAAIKDQVIKSFSGFKKNKNKKEKSDDDAAPNTKWKHIQRVNKFLNYCVDNRYLEYNPIPKELQPLYQRKPVKYFTDEELARIKAYFFDNNREMYLLIVFVEMTGCRIDEAIQLKWEQITAKEIRIIGKTDRYFPIFPFPKLPKLLKDLQKLDNGEKVFIWNYQQVPQRFLKRAKEELHIDNPYSFHSIRKMTLDKWKEAGISIEVRSQLAGHSVSVQTKEYNSDPDWQYFKKVLQGYELNN